MDFYPTASERAGSRFSTATGGGLRFVGLCLSKLPSGRLINLGAGDTGASCRGSIVVNVDHVAPIHPTQGIFVVADVHALPFRVGVFDGILAKDLLEHLSDPIAALREMRVVARNEAALLITVPRAIARAVWDDPTHVRGFTARALRTAMGLGGWRADVPLRRMGSIPGFGRLGLVAYVEHALRLPLFGHWFGTNWMALTVAAPADATSGRTQGHG